ncbi:MAG: flagellar motor protein MotD [Gammaproteobacteria bacterium]|nr:flagellar motor protein MotD [Gammaproteobacteria bacterium]
MARKQKHEEHENHERWLVSYADFITLLFAFFVVMYALSSVNEGKYRVLSDSLVAAFRSAPRSMDPVQLGEIQRTVDSGSQSVIGEPSLIALPIPVVPDVVSESDLQQSRPRPRPPGAAGPAGYVDPGVQHIAEAIVEAMGGLIRDDLIRVRRDERWLEVEIRSSILFPSGSARLTPDSFPILEQLAKILAPFPNPIHVEGFTDNVPISTVQYLSNWELSAARAASVVHLFTDYGVEPGRMAAIGYGEYKPVAPNDTPEGRARNRRVVLVIMPGADPRWERDPQELPDAMRQDAGGDHRGGVAP